MDRSTGWKGDSVRLLACKCRDVIALSYEWRECLCGETAGQYRDDDVTCVVAGPGKLYGVSNELFGWSGPHPNGKLAFPYDETPHDATTTVLRLKYNPNMLNSVQHLGFGVMRSPNAERLFSRATKLGWAGPWSLLSIRELTLMGPSFISQRIIELLVVRPADSDLHDKPLRLIAWKRRYYVHPDDTNRVMALKMSGSKVVRARVVSVV